LWERDLELCLMAFDLNITLKKQAGHQMEEQAPAVGDVKRRANMQVRGKILALAADDH